MLQNQRSELRIPDGARRDCVVWVLSLLWEEEQIKNWVGGRKKNSKKLNKFPCIQLDFGRKKLRRQFCMFLSACLIKNAVREWQTHCVSTMMTLTSDWQQLQHFFMICPCLLQFKHQNIGILSSNRKSWIIVKLLEKKVSGWSCTGPLKHFERHFHIYCELVFVLNSGFK